MCMAAIPLRKRLHSPPPIPPSTLRKRKSARGHSFRGSITPEVSEIESDGQAEQDGVELELDGGMKGNGQGRGDTPRHEHEVTPDYMYTSTKGESNDEGRSEHDDKLSAGSAADSVAVSTAEHDH